MKKSYFETLGRNEKRDFNSPNTGHIIRALRVQSTGDYLGYIHDGQLYTRFYEMTDETVGRLMHMAKADNLKSMGYDGARSNSGETLTTIYTSALHALQKEFGKDAVVSDMKRGFRGLKNDMRVKKRFIAIMDDIVDQLLEGLVADLGDTDDELVGTADQPDTSAE